jgi:alpha-tubulin suppressor-like RCC1 family protein
MNGLKRIWKNWTAKGVVLATLVLFVMAQASPAFAATGAVTTWGGGYPTPQPVALPAGVTASFVSSGEDGVYAITNDGVYFWYGVVNITPTKFAFPAAVSQVSFISDRFSHALAITNDGLYAWGQNNAGQVGDGTTTSSWNTPVKVLFPAAVTSVTAAAAGYWHSLAITNDGLYAWGDNQNGELGDGTRTNRLLPVKVALPASVTTVTAIAAGQNSSYAVTNDGVYAWGNDFAGQLGNGSFGILPDGTSDLGQVLPVKVLFNSKGKTVVTSVSAIAAGEHYALAITNDGLYAWGENLAGALGIGSLTNTAYPTKVQFSKRTAVTVQSISAGRNHSLAITSDGLYAWGDNSYGKLGLGTMGQADSYRSTPAKVPGEGAAIMAAAGDYFSVAIH